MNWIKCSDRLPPVITGEPEYGTSSRVLVWYPGLKLPVTSFYWYAERVWCDDESMGPHPAWCQATHWMPLPDPPITESVPVDNPKITGPAPTAQEEQK